MIGEAVAGGNAEVQLAAKLAAAGVIEEDGAAVHVRALEVVELVVTGHRGERHAVAPDPLQVQHHATVIRLHHCHLIVVGRDLLVESRPHSTAAYGKGIGVEHVRIRAFLVEAVQFQQGGEGVVGIPGKLDAPGGLLETAEIVARAVIQVVDPFIALLVLE